MSTWECKHHIGVYLDGPGDAGLDCHLTVVYWFPGRAGSYHSPPEDPEVDYADEVRVEDQDGKETTVTFEEFLVMYQTSRYPTVVHDEEQARVNLDIEVLDLLEDQFGEEDPDEEDDR